MSAHCRVMASIIASGQFLRSAIPDSYFWYLESTRDVGKNYFLNAKSYHSNNFQRAI